MVFYKNGTVLKKYLSITKYVPLQTEKHKQKKSLNTPNIQTVLQNYGWACVSPCYDE